MSDADSLFSRALRIFQQQVGEVTQFWYAAATINEVARRDGEVLRALNLTPTLWLTVRLALESQAILTAAKVFGPQKTNPHNIDWLFLVVHDTRAVVFSKAAFAARKRAGSANADEWLDDYIKHIHVPTTADIRRLRQLSRRYRRIYESQYKDVRNLSVAHNVLVDQGARTAMFQKTRMRDFERLVVFLNQLYDVLWGIYHNGQRPTLRPMSYSVRSLVARKLNELRDNANHEHIVAEARMCMSLLVRAATALPHASRDDLRWLD